MDNLVYRRQFILSSKELVPLSHWQHLKLDDDRYRLYAHPDLELAEIKDAGKRIILLGYIFDAQNPRYSNYDVLKELISAQSFRDLIKATYRYAGRFVLIFEDGSSAKLMHDCAGLRQIYYTTGTKEVWCGSQPSILAGFLDLEKSHNKVLKDFCNSREFESRHKAWAGDGTMYDNVKHLMPNHYLDLGSRETHRYWPDETIGEMSIDEAVGVSTKYLKGFIKCASERYELMLAVTAGWDTRVLLAASREKKDEIFYFINKHKYLRDESPDIRVPRRLLNKLGLKFNVIEYSRVVDDEFRSIFKNNVTLSREILLPAIYNVYYVQFPNRMNVNGDASGIVRNYFDVVDHADNLMLAELAGYKNLEYPMQEYAKWLERSCDVAKEHDVSILDLFYWEERMGNWGALGPSETDIAMEEFSPFNCRDLLTVMLSVNKKYRDMFSSRLYREMVKKMWSEALSEPVNPSARFALIRILKNLRLYPTVRFFYKKILNK